ncbi:hypothetical protein DYB32_003741 [Aphanomyces invadans]|uniref:Sfi1 spindle body domain-containing protein n=1 Tax=Aphanomyces invadans TaxID=157072 RepID=A0A3R6VZ25_9STRA|nr:hypothetical protein DYB32_003741 [Aphanomyces invadans]
MTANGSYDMITPDMVKAELHRDAIRTIRSRAVYHRSRMYFRLFVAHVWIPMKANAAKAHLFFREKTVLKVGTAWVQHFRTFQLERELQRVNDRRTFDRFPQYYNIRRIDFHYHRTMQRKHFVTWSNLHRRCKLVQKRFEQASLRMLLQLVRAWRIRAAYQHRLRDATVREWKAYCVPFQAWVLCTLQRKQRHATQDSLIRAFHRRQHRHTTYSFFRIWKHHTLFGHVDGIHSRVTLIQTLEQQKAYCLSLEENAVGYQHVISTLEMSLADEKLRLQAKEAELEALHAHTQATRCDFRVEMLLTGPGADIHPGTIRRIERMYTDESILAGELKDVIHLHLLRTAETQHAAHASYEQHVLEHHMHADTADDQLLLRRVKWVLNRLHLHYDTTADAILATPQDVQALTMQMHQLHALYEFLRSGDTTSLVEENIPLSKEPQVLEASLVVPGEIPRATLDGPALLATDDTWSKFVQDVAQKFPPKRHVPIQDRLVSYALNRVEEKRLAQWESQKPTIYRYCYRSQRQSVPLMGAVAECKIKQSHRTLM